MYGVHPYYTIVEPDGNTHSVLILNSNAQGKFRDLENSVVFGKSIQQPFR